MKRIVLFSTLTQSNSKAILDQIFPSEIKNKVLSYVPSNGVEGAEPYIEEWGEIAKQHEAKYNVIDNSILDTQQQAKLLASNIIVISGGNTFSLLHNLRHSKLDASIAAFAKKPNFVLAGFSAGALVLTPSIAVCNVPSFDENVVGIDDFSGLGVVDFEIFPHYDENVHKTILDEYRKTTTNIVREISDEECIVIHD